MTTIKNKNTKIKMDKTASLQQMLFTLIQSLTRDADPQATLLEMTTEIRKATNSDRVNLHYVKRTANGPFVDCWDQNQNSDKTDFFKLYPDEGLTSWVLQNNDWLIANAKKPHCITDLTEAESGSHGVIKRSPSRTQKYNRADNESAMCFIPLPIGTGAPSVILEITRINNEEPYHRDEIEKLVEVTPIIASVGMRVLEIEQMALERKAIKQLATQINESTPISETNNLLIKTLVELTGAFGAVMVQYSSSHYYCIASQWIGAETHKVLINNLSDAFNSFSYAEQDLDITTTDTLINNTDNVLNSLTTDSFRLISRAKPFVITAQKKVILLIDKLDVDFDLYAPTNSKQMFESCKQVIEYSNSLFTQYKKAHIRHVIKELTNEHRNSTEPGVREDFEQSLKVLIDSTLKTIKKTCQCDAALIYLGDLQTVEVKGLIPKTNPAVKLTVKNKSLTKQVIRDRKTRLIADVLDKESKFYDNLNQDDLNLLKQAVKIKELKSWLTSPITLYDDISDGQCYGVIKLITARKSVMISFDTKQVLEAIAQRTYWEYHYLLKQYALFDLNQITTKLTGIRGNTLRSELTKELERWAQQYIRHNCKIFIYAYTKDKKTLLQCASTELTSKQKNALSEASIAYSAEHKDKTKSEQKYTAIPIKVNQIEDIKGHLFFISDNQLSKMETNICKDASNEILQLVYQEYLHYHQKEYFAVLRHSLMGPVQGLTSFSQMALRKARQSVTDQKSIDKIERGICEESEAIRRWRDVSKILGEGAKAEIRPHHNNLTRIINHCIKRYQPIAKDRNIVIHNENSGDENHRIFEFDKQAMDIVISNLLDNAVKYAFFNTSIYVKTSIYEHKIIIKVTDTGHKTPEDNIFVKGKRLDWDDPFRTIGGEGYGLAICKSLIDAHGGRISAKSTPENIYSLSDEKTRKYRVTFTVTLPYPSRLN